MNEKILPFLAIILSLVAISAAVVVQPDTEIKSGSIDSKKLANGSVTSNKLADNTVTGDDIADGSISDKDINDSGISKFKPNSIKKDHLTLDLFKNLAGNASLSNDSITSAEIKDYTIKKNDIANNSVSSDKILDDTITDDDIGSNAVGNDELKDDSVDSDNIIDGSVGSDDIDNDAVDGNHIQDESVGTEDLKENAITEFWQKNTSLGVGFDSTMEQDEFVNLTYATLNITTGNNPLLILFSGVFSASVAEEAVQIMLYIDGNAIIPTTRKGTSVSGDSTFTLSFNYITILSSEEHTIQVRWRVAPSGIAPTANAYNRVLNIIELKK